MLSNKTRPSSHDDNKTNGEAITPIAQKDSMPSQMIHGPMTASSRTTQMYHSGET